MKILKTVLTALLVLTLIFTADVYGLSYEASNHYELKNIILEQMKEYNTEFNIRYTGSLDNIKEVLEETVNSDIYLNSNVSRVDWNISGTKTLSNIKVKVSYILTREERIEADKIIDDILKEIANVIKEKGIRRFIEAVGEERLEDMFELIRADMSGKASADYEVIEKLKTMCERELRG
jgi:hypothetical protein